MGALQASIGLAAPMSPAWLAVIGGDEDPSPAPVARADLDGPDGPLGRLAAWIADESPHPAAARVDPRVLDRAGPPGAGWLTLVPPGLRVPFDDLAVQAARRAVLAGPPRRLVTTLLHGDGLFAGALTLVPDDEPPGLLDDPFGRVAPALAVRVGPGLLGRVAAPAGPVIERHGSGNPWPADRFG